MRLYEVLEKIFDWNKGVSSYSILRRYFRKIETIDNDEIFGDIQRKWFELFSIGKVTIHIESTLINSFFPHHPLIAFCSEFKMVVNAWMRDGNSGVCTNFG